MRAIGIAILMLLIAAAAHADDFTLFRTPSDNIHCMFIAHDDGTTSLGCEIHEMNNTEPALPRPADCDLDWGDTFWIEEHGKAGLSCHGDTMADPNSRRLAYGRSITQGGISCQSEKTGLTCTNRDGHGFGLSRARQELF